MSNIKILNTFIINMQDIVFATNNSHKLEEIRRIIGGKFRILSLKEIGCEDDIPETADTLEGNAIMKARYVVCIQPDMPVPVTTAWPTCHCC